MEYLNQDLSFKIDFIIRLSDINKENEKHYL